MYLRPKGGSGMSGGIESTQYPGTYYAVFSGNDGYLTPQKITIKNNANMAYMFNNCNMNAGDILASLDSVTNVNCAHMFSNAPMGGFLNWHNSLKNLNGDFSYMFANRNYSRAKSDIPLSVSNISGNMACMFYNSNVGFTLSSTEQLTSLLCSPSNKSYMFNKCNCNWRLWSADVTLENVNCGDCNYIFSTSIINNMCNHRINSLTIKNAIGNFVGLCTPNYLTVIDSVGDFGIYAGFDAYNYYFQDITIDPSKLYFENVSGSINNFFSRFDKPTTIPDFNFFGINGAASGVFYLTKDFTLPNLTIPNTVNDISSLFESAINLRLDRDLNVPNSVIDISRLFYNCKDYRNYAATGTPKYNLSIPDSVQKAEYVFYNAEIQNMNIDLSNATNLKYMSGMFYYSNYNPASFTMPPNAIECSNLFSTCSYFNCPVTITSKVTSCDYMFKSCGRYNSLVTFSDSVINCAHMFNYCSTYNQETIISDSVINCSNMFVNCFNLNKSVHISNNAVDCSNMFCWCNNFNCPVTIPNINVNCSNMFRLCKRLNIPITIPNSVTDCSYMFYSCSNLDQKIDIPDTITNYAGLFRACSNFTNEINIPSHVTDISYILYTATNYTRPIVLEGVNAYADYAFAYSGITDFTINNSTLLLSNYFVGSRNNLSINMYNTILDNNTANFIGGNNTFVNMINCNIKNGNNMFHLAYNNFTWHMKNTTMNMGGNAFNVLNSDISGRNQMHQMDINFENCTIDDCSYLFANMYYFNNSVKITNCKINSASRLFMGCNQLNSFINLSGSTINDMSYMFASLDFASPTFNFKNVKTNNISGLFSMCNGFNQPVNLTQFIYDSDKGLNMSSAFSQIQNFNSSVNMNGIKASNCFSLFCYSARYDVSHTYLPDYIGNLAYAFYDAGRLCNSGHGVHNVYIKHGESVTSAYNIFNCGNLNFMRVQTNVYVNNMPIEIINQIFNNQPYYTMTNGYYNSSYNLYVYTNYAP